MAMGGFFSRVSRNAGANDGAGPMRQVVPIASDDAVRRLELLDTFEKAGLGWFWATDANGRLTYLTRSACEAHGWAPEDIIGTPLTELFTTDSDGADEREGRPLAFLLGARNSISELPVTVKRATETTFWEIAGKPQHDDAGEFTGYRGSAKNITSSREKQRDAERMAQFDSLTGLSNRRRMEMRLDKTLKSYRNSKQCCALMMLDLDRFKQVNDTLGHPAGDELLKQFAARLQQMVGHMGDIGRVGGDEFQIMLPNIDDRGVLGDLSGQLIQMLSQPYSINGLRAVVGASIGVAIAPYDGLDSEEIVKAADLALYSAKGSGRGKYRFYSSDLKDGANHRRQVEEDLRDALAKDEMAMHYQPIIDVETNKVSCFEALMRWEHPDKGNIPPAEFIPVAEEINHIKALGDWALERVCRDAAAWPVPLRVAVNVSAIQFVHDDFSAIVDRVLKSTGLAPDRLELEITESVFLGDTGRTQRMFEELKAIGVRLALDDFGTGYSSLSYLRTAPFDKIKIDQSFVRGATESGNNNRAIMSAIVGLAEALGMQTVAEGVETKDELELVKKRGASHVQGYIFSAAMPNDEVVARLESNSLEYEARGPEKYRADRRTVFRRIGVIIEDYRYRAVMRNLSKTGAMIEGLAEVPLGTNCVLDLGGGQLAVATVRRSRKSVQGVEFETPLISDGAEGWCTRHRVSPYEIEAAGRPLTALPQDAYTMLFGEQQSRNSRERKFVEVEVGPPRAITGTRHAA
ncbi:diguanylate phosphodiesterase [Erythrobacter sp. QSSC1-22B]|nr:diguanylate phosphodiesterase [Erythrobacter sp. QSSC1-22B]